MKLTRMAYLPFGTFGELILPSGKKLYTVERPWVNNMSRISCIPEGTYELKKRVSPIVKQTSKYDKGWEVTNVPNRSLIMIHVANWPHNVEGCIGVGSKLGVLSNKLAVLDSGKAFSQLMEELEIKEKWSLEITRFSP